MPACFSTSRSGTHVVPTCRLAAEHPGTFVYVVKPEQTAAVRPVKIGPTEGDHVSIDEGLSPG